MLNSKKMQTSYLITAILFILAGVILITWPQTTLKVICYGLGGLIFIFGAFQIYTYYKGKDEEFNFQMNLLTGLIACGIGLFMLLKSEIVISILPFITGFTLLLESLIKFKNAFDLKKAGYDGFKWIAVLGAISLIFAGLLMYNPFDAATSMVMFIGICLIFDGLGELWTLYCVRKYIEVMNDAIVDVAVKEETVSENPEPEVVEEQQDDKSADSKNNTKFVNITIDEDQDKENKTSDMQK